MLKLRRTYIIELHYIELQRTYFELQRLNNEQG